MKKIIIILAALVCFSSCAHRVQSKDYMVVEKERYTVNEGISEYTVKTRMKDGTYKLGKIKFRAPSNTYNIGDRVYFAVED
jgi:hypothetical protein